MIDRRMHPGLRRPVVAIVLGCAAIVGSARAGGWRERAVPPYALQPPGASFEGEPAVGGVQVVQIARELIKASVAALAHAPLHSAAQVVGRSLERQAVRVRAMSTRPHRTPLDVDRGRHSPGDRGGDFGGPPTPICLTLLPSSEGAMQALLRLIATARGRIDLMMYGWEDDATGREVAAALAARARQGVQVRLLVDRTGYLIHNAPAARGCPTFLDDLRAVANVSVIESPGALLRFDHRKLAVVDGHIIWSGGTILSEASRRRWHNLAFVAQGPIVAQYACLFEERWRELGGYPAVATGGDDGRAFVPNATARMIRTDIGVRSLKDAIYHTVDHAQHRIYLENPYFSDEILGDKLVAARARGVDVHAVLTLRGNVERLNRYETLTANRLFRGGVRVYLFPIMTHVKAMSVDGVWAYLGTGNFDELSLRNNREVGLSVTGAGVVADLDRALFFPDIAASQELTALLPRPRNRLLLRLFAPWY